MTGYIQLYTGDGKGKTTAALGLALRAAGHGFRTYIGQFMKGQPYGELDALTALPQITLEQYGDIHCVRKEEVTDHHRRQARQGLAKVREAMRSGQYTLVILDEVLVTLWFGLLTLEEVIHVIDDKPRDVELVLTGRKAPPELIERADLVTEMTNIKHYYDSGVPARDGIER